MRRKRSISLAVGLRARRACRGHRARRARGRAGQRGHELEPDRDEHARRVPCGWRAERRLHSRSTWGWSRARCTTRSTRSSRGIEPYLLQTTFPSTASKEAAVATAAYRSSPTSSRRCPRRIPFPPARAEPCLQALDRRHYAASLAAIPDSQSKTDGIAAGNAAADAMIAARQGDGRFGPSQWEPNTGPGHWQPLLTPNGTPMLDPTPWVGGVRAVPDAELLAVPQRRPERAHQRRLREGLQRGQGARRRRGGQHRPARPSRRTTRSSGRAPGARPCCGTVSPGTWSRTRATASTSTTVPCCSRC